MNSIPKVVFSGTLERADWGPDSRVAAGELAGEVQRLRREPGADMLAWGGAAFAQALSRAAVVDEYRLILQPVALGEGLRCSRTYRSPCGSSWSKPETFPTGAALHVYRPVRT